MVLVLFPGGWLLVLCLVYFFFDIFSIRARNHFAFFFYHKFIAFFASFHRWKCIFGLLGIFFSWLIEVIHFVFFDFHRLITRQLFHEVVMFFTRIRAKLFGIPFISHICHFHWFHFLFFRKGNDRNLIFFHFDRLIIFEWDFFVDGIISIIFY